MFLATIAQLQTLSTRRRVEDRGAIIQLWDKFKEEWKRKLIAGAVALSFGVLALFGKSALYWLRSLNADLQCISRDEAVRVSKEYLGQGVESAIPFRNVGDDHQYIAALVNTRGSGPFGNGREAFVLVSRGDKYETHLLNTTVLDEYAKDKSDLHDIFGVEKLEGRQRVFAVYRGGGNRYYTIQVDLYDPVEGTEYTATQECEYTCTTFNPNLSDNVVGKVSILNWLETKGQKLILGQINPASIGEESTLWQQSQGDNFKGGQIKIHEFAGKIPAQGSPGVPSIVCEVEDSEFIGFPFLRTECSPMTKSVTYISPSGCLMTGIIT